MRKKLLTVALAATMVVSSVFSAFAAETKIENKELAADSYEEMDNPLKGKNAEKVTISYTINWNADAPRNGWDGVFSFFDAASNDRVSFQTAPYLCYNANGTTAEDWVDMKADAWCTANCEPGQDYTFTYVITKDAVTVSCNGTNIAEFAAVGQGEAFTGYQEILDALNTYPTLTVGVGIAKSSFWNTEPCKISITIDDGIDASVPAPGNDDETQAPANNDDETQASANNDNAGKNPPTGDTSAVAVVAIVALGAAVAVVASKKKVTE